MTAPLTQHQVQSCARAAMADTVREIGGIGMAAIETGRSEDTIRRNIAGTHGGWNLDDAMALGAVAINKHGRFLLVDRLVSLIASGSPPSIDPRRLMQDITTTLPNLLSQAQVMAAAIADRQLQRDELRIILAGIPSLRAELDRLEAETSAALKAAP